MYLKVLRDVLCEFKIWITSGLCYPLKYNIDTLNIKSKVISRSKKTRMNRKKEDFVKSLVGSC